MAAGHRKALKRAAIMLGGAGLGGYLYSVDTSGGLYEVYSIAHRGEGLQLSGYIRDLKWLLVPAIIFIFWSTSGRRFNGFEIAIIALFSAPLLFRAIILGSRGTMFVIVSTLLLSWWFTRGRRPSLLFILTGGIVLSFVMLFLVTHRDVLHLGAERFELKGADRVLSFLTRDSTGQEYIYGAGTIITAQETGDYEWGARYVEKIVIRAIPRFLWPSQYEDVRAFLGMPENRLRGQVEEMSWAATGGASAGLFPDLWRQFWWLYVIITFAIGSFFGRIWRKAREYSGMHLALYIIVMAFSLYLTQQTLQSWLWRILFVGGIAWMVWRSEVHPRWRRGRVPRRRV